MSELDIQQLPIDIHYSKLLDWLISRRHCKRDWYVQAVEIRKSLKLAMRDMPDHPLIKKLLGTAFLDYFHCKDLIDVLMETEADSKNLFGSYTSHRMTDWKEVISKFEKENVYLAECSQVLIRYVSYEIPSLKRQIQKCQQVQQDSIRLQEEYATSITSSKDKFMSKCQQLGIQGHQIKFELLHLTTGLPLVYKGIEDTIKELRNAVKFYDEFTAFVIKRKVQDLNTLEMVKHFLEHGNCTLYQWKTGIVPLDAVRPELSVDRDSEQLDDWLLSDAANETELIDWGDIDVDGIDFGIEVDDSSAGITVVPDSELEPVQENVPEKTRTDENTKDEVIRKTITGADAWTLLDDLTTRNLLLSDLSELESFLSQRNDELLHSESDVISTIAIQNAPLSIQLESQTVSDMLQQVRSVLGQLTSVRIQHLFSIQNTPNYIDRLATELTKQRQQASKFESLQQLQSVRREEAIAEQARLIPILDQAIADTKQLQTQLCREISVRYNGRPVNIVGEINLI